MPLAFCPCAFALNPALDVNQYVHAEESRSLCQGKGPQPRPPLWLKILIARRHLFAPKPPTRFSTMRPRQSKLKTFKFEWQR